MVRQRGSLCCLYKSDCYSRTLPFSPSNARQDYKSRLLCDPERVGPGTEKSSGRVVP